METAKKQQIITQLRQKILEMQGFKPTPMNELKKLGLKELEACFPHCIFPIGVIHEFMANNIEQRAACAGFIAGILAQITEVDRPCLWISSEPHLYPPALKYFGVTPEKIIFIDIKQEKKLLWVLEEGLKCEGLGVVIAELPDINFSQSRRLQLAVEKSRVTGILLRTVPKSHAATACTVRWQITSLPSESTGLPGVGHSCWNVTLLKVRNGQTGNFSVSWTGKSFAMTESLEQIFTPQNKQTG